MKLQLQNLQAKASSIILIQSEIPIFPYDIKPLLTTQIECSSLTCKLGIIRILKFKKNSSLKVKHLTIYFIGFSLYTACLYLFLKQNLSIGAWQAWNSTCKPGWPGAHSMFLQSLAVGWGQGVQYHTQLLQVFILMCWIKKDSHIILEIQCL